MFSKIDTSNAAVRKTAIVIGVVLLILGGLLFWKGRPAYPWFAGFGGGILVIGTAIPILFKPFHILWIGFSLILGLIMTRVILTLLFFLVVTPISIAARLTGKDFLSLKQKGQVTYWVNKEDVVKDKSSYEKQF